MPQQFHQFQVKFPIQGTISFVGRFNEKKAPIFIESLGDQSVVFYSHLELPIKHKNETVQYLYKISFLYEEFDIEGVILRNLTYGKANIQKFEGKFNIKEEQRSQLFKALNQYSIMLNKLKKQKLSTHYY
ncbi:hypothetical protein [Viridibacillus arvi]|uniref:hypothetical protein n=1 Tax=Viridibacillus arvi TaxID=263475 RepID=UPI0034CF1614